MSQGYDLEVNGVVYPVSTDHTRNLLSVIRTEIGLTGTKEGCDDCECGACMVLIDGQPVNSCSYLAAQAAGRSITTIEGVMDGDELDVLQRNLLDEGGVQCGFCTPGMVISARALLEREPNPTEEEIRIGLSGNLCRCTGYAKIVSAVDRSAAERASGQADPVHSRSAADRVMPAGAWEVVLYRHRSERRTLQGP